MRAWIIRRIFSSTKCGSVVRSWLQRVLGKSCFVRVGAVLRFAPDQTTGASADARRDRSACAPLRASMMTARRASLKAENTWSSGRSSNQGAGLFRGSMIARRRPAPAVVERAAAPPGRRRRIPTPAPAAGRARRDRDEPAPALPIGRSRAVFTARAPSPTLHFRAGNSAAPPPAPCSRYFHTRLG